MTDPKHPEELDVKAEAAAFEEADALEVTEVEPVDTVAAPRTDDAKEEGTNP